MKTKTMKTLQKRLKRKKEENWLVLKPKNSSLALFISRSKKRTIWMLLRRTANFRKIFKKFKTFKSREKYSDLNYRTSKTISRRQSGTTKKINWRINQKNKDKVLAKGIFNNGVLIINKFKLNDRLFTDHY